MYYKEMTKWKIKLFLNILTVYANKRNISVFISMVERLVYLHTVQAYMKKGTKGKKVKTIAITDSYLSSVTFF